MKNLFALSIFMLALMLTCCCSTFTLIILSFAIVIHPTLKTPGYVTLPHKWVASPLISFKKIMRNQARQCPQLKPLCF